MFEFDAGKLVIIAIVALIVIGPKDLPRVMRQIGQALAKLRRMSAEFQAQFTEAIREADVADLKAEAEKLSDAARIDIGSDPLDDIRHELNKDVEVFRPDVSPEVAAGEHAQAEHPQVGTILPDESSHAHPEDPTAAAEPKAEPAAFPQHEGEAGPPPPPAVPVATKAQVMAEEDPPPAPLRSRG